MEETTFELRELKSSDVFPMVQILNKVGFKELKTVLTPDKVKDMMKSFKEAGSETSEDGVDKSTILGFNLMLEIVGIVMNNLPSCEEDLYRFISNVSGLSVKEIADLPMGDFAEVIIAIVQKQEFKDFFKAVSKLFN